MPENIQTEGNPQPAGGLEQPASTPSGSESQPLPEYVTALQSQLAQVQAELRGQQKGADKRFGQLQGDIKRILELKDQGLNESQISRELFLDGLIQNQSAPAPAPAGNGQGNTSFDVEPILKSLQFPENDPNLAALRIKYTGNPQALLKAAAELRLSQATSPTPTPGNGLPVGGGSNISGPDTNSLIAELQGLQRTPTRNRERIRELTTELEKRGWV